MVVVNAWEHRFLVFSLSEFASVSKINMLAVNSALLLIKCILTSGSIKYVDYSPKREAQLAIPMILPHYLVPKHGGSTTNSHLTLSSIHSQQSPNSNTQEEYPERNSSKFALLPKDIIGQITQFLNIKDGRSFALTNTLIRNVIDSLTNHQFWNLKYLVTVF